MILWTIQDKNAVQKLEQDSVFVCDPQKSFHIQECNFRESYDWLSSQMRKRLIDSHDSIHYPVWAWHTYDHKTRIDRRISYIKSLPEDTYVLHLEMDDSRVLLSDFDKWHYVLNNIAYREDEYENTDITWSDTLTEEEKQKTWESIFDVRNSQTIQATFWNLTTEDIVKIEKLR